MLPSIDPENTGTIDFATFVILMTKKIKDDDTYEELLEVKEINIIFAEFQSIRSRHYRCDSYFRIKIHIKLIGG
jgi:Ca2+-binding EF-hand superfamily protein